MYPYGPSYINFFKQKYYIKGILRRFTAWAWVKLGDTKEVEEAL